MLSEWAAFSERAKAFAEGEACLRVAGLTGSARAMVVAGLAKTHPRPLLVVAATLADAHRFTQDLKFFGTPAVEFPEREPRLWRGGGPRGGGAGRGGGFWLPAPRGAPRVAGPPRPAAAPPSPPPGGRAGPPRLPPG